MNTLRSIFDFFHLNFTAQLKSDIYKTFSLSGSSTKKITRPDTPYSLERNPKFEMYEWQRSLTWQQVKAIQDRCKEAMRLWGYRMANSENDYKDISPILRFDQDIAY